MCVYECVHVCVCWESQGENSSTTCQFQPLEPGWQTWIFASGTLMGPQVDTTSQEDPSCCLGFIGYMHLYTEANEVILMSSHTVTDLGGSRQHLNDT